LDKVAALKYAPWGEKLATARANLERARQESRDQARKALVEKARADLGAALDRFEELELAGEPGKAAEELRAAREKAGPERAALMGPELAAAEELAAELAAHFAALSKARAGLTGREVELRLRGGETVRGGLERCTADAVLLKVLPPGGAASDAAGRRVRLAELDAAELARFVPEPPSQGAAGQMAQAAALAWSGRPAEAQAALARAGAHPLAARWRQRLQAAASAARAAADRDWQEGPGRAAAGRDKPELARALLAALDAFAERHAGSGGAEARAAEAERLRAEAWRALGPAVYTRWPCDAAEARRRQQETACRPSGPWSSAPAPNWSSSWSPPGSS
jgi:hypothetical protein